MESSRRDLHNALLCTVGFDSDENEPSLAGEGRAGGWRGGRACRLARVAELGAEPHPGAAAHAFLDRRNASCRSQALASPLFRTIFGNVSKCCATSQDFKEKAVLNIDHSSQNRYNYGIMMHNACSIDCADMLTKICIILLLP